MVRSNVLLGSEKNAVLGPSNALTIRINAGRVERGGNANRNKVKATINTSSSSTYANKFLYQPIGDRNLNTKERKSYLDRYGGQNPYRTTRIFKVR